MKEAKMWIVFVLGWAAGFLFACLVKESMLLSLAPGPIWALLFVVAICTTYMIIHKIRYEEKRKREGKTSLSCIIGCKAAKKGERNERSRGSSQSSGE